MRTISIPSSGDILIKRGEQFQIRFTDDGDFVHNDHDAFCPELKDKHYKKGTLPDIYTAAADYDHDDDYEFTSDRTEQPLVMHTIRITNTVVDEKRGLPSPDAIAAAAEQAWEKVFDKLSAVKTTEGASGIQFYPHGITNIQVSVGFAGITITVQVSGPNS